MITYVISSYPHSIYKKVDGGIQTGSSQDDETFGIGRGTPSVAYKIYLKCCKELNIEPLVADPPSLTVFETILNSAGYKVEYPQMTLDELRIIVDMYNKQAETKVDLISYHSFVWNEKNII